MIALFIASLLLLALCAAGAVWTIRQTYAHVVDGLRADNKDLRDRLFQSKAMPPSGVDLTEVYEERKQADREHKEHSGKKVPAGPVERLVDKWAEKDRKAAQSGIDLTEPKHRAN